LGKNLATGVGQRVQSQKWIGVNPEATVLTKADTLTLDLGKIKTICAINPTLAETLDQITVGVVPDQVRNVTIDAIKVVHVHLDDIVIK